MRQQQQIDEYLSKTYTAHENDVAFFQGFCIGAGWMLGIVGLLAFIVYLMVTS